MLWSVTEMKHFDERRIATKDCMQSKVACNYKLRIHVSLYTRIRAHEHTCIIVYTYSRMHVSLYTHMQAHLHHCIHEYMYSGIHVYSAGSKAPGHQAPGHPARATGTHPGPYYARGSWKLLRELEAGTGAGNKKRSWN